jgi:hypothetical protein
MFLPPNGNSIALPVSTKARPLTPNHSFRHLPQEIYKSMPASEELSPLSMQFASRLAPTKFK